MQVGVDNILLPACIHPNVVKHWKRYGFCNADDQLVAEIQTVYPVMVFRETTFLLKPLAPAASPSASSPTLHQQKGTPLLFFHISSSESGNAMAGNGLLLAISNSFGPELRQCKMFRLLGTAPLPSLPP